MQRIDLPSHAITLCEPWAEMILSWGKRIENRPQAVATMARRHLGERIALTVSRSVYVWPEDVFSSDARPRPIASKAAQSAIMETLIGLRMDGPLTDAVIKSISIDDMVARAGHVVGTALLEDVLAPGDVGWDAWHDGESWALVLGDPQPIEPIPCTGGQNFWRLVRHACGRPMPAGRKQCPVCDGKAKPIPRSKAVQLGLFP